MAKFQNTGGKTQVIICEKCEDPIKWVQLASGSHKGMAKDCKCGRFTKGGIKLK